MSKLKQLAFAALALFSATFGAEAKSVIVDYYLGNEYKGTAVDYVTPYWAILGNSPVTFTLKNNPTGWKVSDWLVATSDLNMQMGACTPLGIGDVTSYTWTNLTSEVGTYALAVRFEPISYTIHFDAKGGEGEMEDLELAYGVSKQLSKNRFKLAGYAFTGWSLDEEAEVVDFADRATVYNLTDVDGDEITLYAVWKPNDYTVHFDANGGEGTMKDMGCVYGETAYLPESAFTCDGYEFAGWNTSANGKGTAYEDGAEILNLAEKPGETVTLYAQWSGVGYTVAFDGNGGAVGDGGTMSDQEFTFGVAQRLSKNEYVREGYVFAGWNSQKNGGGEVFADREKVKNLTDEPDGLVTLYAIWGKVAYTVEFYANGGEGAMYPVEYIYGSGESLPKSKYTREGYTFDHWCTKPDDSGDKYVDESDGSTLTSLTDVTVALYAIWKPNTYSVRFEANGGSGTMPEQEFTYGVKQRLSECAFKMPGAVFDHWNTSADDSGDSFADREDVQDLTAERDGLVVLYAQWRSGSYTIAFDPNCEEGEYSGHMDDQTFVYGKTQKLRFNAYARNSYNFDHWNTEPDDSGDSYEDGAAIAKLTPTVGDTVTFYAIWKGVSYTVKFYKNGGTGEMPDQTLVYGEKQALAKNDFMRDGWVFTGWNTKSDGTGDSYKDCEEVKNLADEEGAEVRLYAQWSDSVYYTIHFDANGGGGSMPDIPDVKYSDSVTLPLNAYTFDNHEFLHWQLEDDDSKTFDDGATVSGLTSKDGDIVTLHAIWVQRFYTVAFEPGDHGKGDPMPNQEFLFGEKQKLSKCAYEADGIYAFAGWKLKGDSSEKLYMDEEEVLDLASTHGETVTLVAQWNDERSDLSKAMHCDNLNWNNVEIKTVNGEILDVDDPYELNNRAREWVPREAAGAGYNPSGSCAETAEEKHMMLCASVTTNGTLSFYYKINSPDSNAKLTFAYSDVEDDFTSEAAIVDRFVFNLEKSTAWKKAEFDIDFADWQDYAGGDFPSKLYLHIKFTSNGTAQIDQMTWTEAPSLSTAPAIFRASPYVKVAKDGRGTVSFDSVDKRVVRGDAGAGDSGAADGAYSGQEERLIPGKGAVTPPRSWAVGKTVTWKATAEKGSVFSHWKGAFVDTLELSVNELRNPSLKFVVPLKFDPKGIEAEFVSVDSDCLGSLALSDETPLGVGIAAKGLEIVDDSKSYVSASVSGLPSGLKFDAKTMAIAGVPKTAGNFVLKVKAKNASGYQWTENLVLRVADASGYVQPYVAPVAPARTQYHPLTVISQDPKLGTVGGTGVYPAGKKVSISARPASGHVFAGWFCDEGFTEPMVFASGEYRKASQSVVVPEIRYLYARFVKADASVDSVVGIAASGSGLSAANRFKWRVGVAVGEDDGVECESLSLMSGSASGLPPGVRFDAARGRFTGAPTKAGSYMATIKVKNASKSSAELPVGIDVAALDDWAQGTFDGAVFVDGDGMVGVVQSLTVSAGGKISGKILMDGASYALSAPSFSLYDDADASYHAKLAGKKGNAAFTANLVLVSEEVDGVLRGAASASVEEAGWGVDIYAWQNLWKKNAKLKELAKAFAGAPDYEFTVDAQSTAFTAKTMLLKFAASGMVTASCSGRSCSTALVPDSDGRYMVFIYYPPKSGEFLAYSSWFLLDWDGKLFYAEEGLVP